MTLSVLLALVFRSPGCKFDFTGRSGEISNIAGVTLAGMVPVGTVADLQGPAQGSDAAAERHLCGRHRHRRSARRASHQNGMSTH
jgi:hypothetical protein